MCMNTFQKGPKTEHLDADKQVLWTLQWKLSLSHRPFCHRCYFLTVAPAQIPWPVSDSQRVYDKSWLMFNVPPQLRDRLSSHLSSNGVTTEPSKPFARALPCQSPSTISARNGYGKMHLVLTLSEPSVLAVSYAWLWTLAMSTLANFTRFMPWLATRTKYYYILILTSHVGHPAWNPLPVSILWCSAGQGQENPGSRGLQRFLESTAPCTGTRKQLDPRDEQPQKRSTHWSKEDRWEYTFNVEKNKRWRVILEQVTTSMCRWYCIRRWR